MNSGPVAHDTSPQAPAEIELQTLLGALWAGRLWLGLFVLVFALLAVIHIYVSKPIYRSTTVVAVRSEDLAGSIGMLRGQLGGIASLAGILPSGGGRRQEFVAFLKSRALAKEFIVSRQLIPLLYPGVAGTADKSASEPVKGEPTLGDAVDLLVDIRQISEDARTGLLTVSFVWTDPDLAASWANDYVALANTKLREEAIADARESITYLNEELSRTTIEPVRQSLYSILEGRLNQAMLASVEHEYAFRSIDRAEPSDPRKYVRPRRAVELFVGVFSGLIFGTMFVLWQFSRGRLQPR